MFNLNQIFILLRTVYYLKAKQVYYRLWYTIRKKWRELYHFRYIFSLTSYSKGIELLPSITLGVIYKKHTFTFLNLSHSFENEIDWNFSENGKLWTYNLTYFDYLQQKEMTKETGLLLIRDFIDQSEHIKDGFMPFPISLRGINWIKFLSTHKIQDQKINDSLYAQYHILMDNLEYHILGNHLLENGFSLLFSAYYFQDEKFYIKAKEILTEELEEQILKDGAHFELSPMYHQIMLFRLLDCINLVQNNNWKDHALLELLTDKSEIMLGWLNSVTYENGNIPLFNDSTNNVAPMTKELNIYAASLKIKTKHLELNDSGYRKIKNDYYEMMIDIGNIGPDYIPGHAHSDTFNFELYIDGRPFIVDTGLSTYELSARRTLERTTASHNTVEVDGVNQSEIWSSFRVARRAKIVHLKENEKYIEATHDGYKRMGILHTRKFIPDEHFIVIEDSMESTKNHKCVAYLHFYPGLLPEIKENNIIILETAIAIHNVESIDIEEYQYAPEFNTLINAFKVKILFSNNLKMEIKI